MEAVYTYINAGGGGRWLRLQAGQPISGYMGIYTESYQPFTPSYRFTESAVQYIVTVDGIDL